MRPCRMVAGAAPPSLCRGGGRGNIGASPGATCSPPGARPALPLHGHHSGMEAARRLNHGILGQHRKSLFLALAPAVAATAFLPAPAALAQAAQAASRPQASGASPVAHPVSSPWDRAPRRTSSGSRIRSTPVQAANLCRTSATSATSTTAGSARRSTTTATEAAPAANWRLARETPRRSQVTSQPVTYINGSSLTPSGPNASLAASQANC